MIIIAILAWSPHTLLPHYVFFVAIVVLPSPSIRVLLLHVFFVFIIASRNCTPQYEYRLVVARGLNEWVYASCRNVYMASDSRITANMEILRFRQRAQDIDSAPVIATFGSRRLGESDIGSVLGAAGISKLLLSPQ
jgi:hypothetical protein